MLLAILHCIPDADDPAAIVARLMAAVPPGNDLVVAHPASDVGIELGRSMGNYNRQEAHRSRLAATREVSRFFTGLDLVQLGVVQRTWWRAGIAEMGPGPRAGQLRRGSPEAIGAVSDAECATRQVAGPQRRVHALAVPRRYSSKRPLALSTLNARRNQPFKATSSS